ncbi:MAG: hypothetical protein KDD46_06165 [Bdellovibrionales bacterium]|nr:hypothetical protein [Bdellovibrionales bacterium]
MKNGHTILALGLVLSILSGCQRMDTFNDEGMLESFTGVMRITPGVDEDVMSEIITTGIMTYNGNGTEVMVADASGEAFSLRDMLLKNASNEDKEDFKEILALKGMHPEDQLGFSGFRGHVITGSNGKEIKIDQFESSTKGIKELNVQVYGFAKIDKSNKMYIKSKIYIYIELEDLKNKLPELLEFFTYGENETPLTEIEDGKTKISIAEINFEGVALTGLI